MLLFALTLLLAAPEASASVRVRGELGMESRLFQGDAHATTEDFNLGPVFRAELKTKKGFYRGLGRVFSRFDLFDPGRTIVLVEELWVGWREAGWKVRAGTQLFNWTATEAFHPADILNSRNFDSDIENAEKIGEPALRVSRAIGDGAIEAYFLPVRFAPQLPGGASRLSLSGTEVGDALWVARDGSLSRGSLEIQGAVRIAQTIGSADLAAHVVHHRDRSQPVAAIDPRNGRPTPIYLEVSQFGGTYQQALGPWLAKVELAWRDFQNPNRPTRLGIISQEDHGQAAIGLEVGWNGASGSESTLILEGQRVFGVNRETRAGLHLFQNDILLGVRHAFNDAQSKEIFASILVDIERNSEFLWSARYSQRITDSWSIKTGFRIVQAPKKSVTATGLETLRAADQIHLTITRHF
ncbi:MAG: hypothetical protein COB53_08560 [Elusimicrobia bacterium]|nr:MAG: hypothetical protein COB53_08560 [Elusimicrobiota bacterium]